MKPKQQSSLTFKFIMFWSILSLHGCGLLLPDSPKADFSLDFNLSQSPSETAVSEKPVFADESIFDSIPDIMGSHAATLTAFADGELLAAWYSYPGDSELEGSRIYMARKPAGAESWSAPTLHIDRPEADGNPVLYSEGNTVWFFQAVVPFGWSTSRIEFQKSEDRGLTWTSPEILNAELGSNTRFPPIRLSDGTLLLPAYDDLWSRSLFFVSKNDGETWKFSSAVSSSPQNIQPSVVQVSTGRLLAVMRNKGQGWLWVMGSDDEGKTWSSPQDSHFPNPDSAAQIVRLANGHLILVLNDSETERRPLSITLSTDEGKTWSSKKILADGTDTYSYPTAIQSPDGLIHIVYSLNRARIRHITLNESWIISDAG